MKIDIDLEGMIAKAAEDAFEPARIQEMLTEQLKSSVKTAISSAFAYRSKFQTMLDERISEAMPSDLEDLGRFGDVVLKQTKIYIQSYMEEQAATMLQARMTELLKPFDKEITLSELVKRLTEKFYDEFYGDCDEEKPTFIVLKNEINNGENDFDLYASPAAHASRYSCEIQARFKEGRCWDLKVNANRLSKEKYIGCHFNADALMLNIYTGQIKVILDETNFDDVYYPGREEY